MDVTFEELAEIHRLNVKASMRCAYDLKHASAVIHNLGGKTYEYQLYENRANRWIQIFNPDNMKNYRDRLHRDISSLESLVKNYRAILEKHGIPDPTPEAPF